MPQFFRTFRRKLGVVLLIVACAFMAISVNFEGPLVDIESGTRLVYRIDPAPGTVRTFADELKFRLDTWSWNQHSFFPLISLSRSSVMPLTLLSAWLLLSRRTTRVDHA